MDRNDHTRTEATDAPTDLGAPVPYPVRRTIFDPPPELAEYRTRRPVGPLRYPDGEVGWLVTSHELGRQLLANPSTAIRFGPLVPGMRDLEQHMSRMREAAGHEPPRAPDTDDPRGILSSDPPQHTSVRRAIAGRFTPKAVEEMRETIEEIVAARLDVIATVEGPVDLIAELAVPTTRKTICAFLGLEDAEVWTIGMFDFDSSSPAEPEAYVTRLFSDRREDLGNALERGIAQLREAPNGGLLSRLFADGVLREVTITSIASELLAGGQTTMVGTIGLAVVRLLHGDPRWWARLAGDPDAARPIVEELIRYTTVFQHGANFRVPTEDIVLGGCPIPAGDRVTVSLSAVNRDPGYIERPDDFDPDRDPGPHLGFGYGIHQCLGQHLVRLELQVLFRRLAERFPRLCLATPVDELPVYDPNVNFMHGVHRLPVTWERPRVLGGPS